MMAKQKSPERNRTTNYNRLVTIAVAFGSLVSERRAALCSVGDGHLIADETCFSLDIWLTYNLPDPDISLLSTSGPASRRGRYEILSLAWSVGCSAASTRLSGLQCINCLHEGP